LGVRYRYPGLSPATQQILRRQGEAGRFEFKQNADGVKVSVLVAAANAAALDRLPSVTILVGVAEQEDEATGVITGLVVGLPDLERAKQRVTGLARSVKPVPPKVEVIEENVATSAPILRVVISPTRPPHYDDNGSRVTRLGASTRAITDEELLDMYLSREADSFRQRFDQIASDLERSVEAVADDVRDVATQADALTRQLTTIESAADQIQGSLDETYEFVTSLDGAIGNLQGSVDELIQAPATVEEALAGLLRSRAMAMTWIQGTSDLGRGHTTEVRATFDELAGQPPALLAYRRNLREADLWRPLIGLDPDTPAQQWLEAADRIRSAQAEEEA
jgi:hypothetical protein